MTFSFCVNSLAAAATTTTATETTAATAARETSADTSNTQATGASYGTSKLSGAPDKHPMLSNCSELTLKIGFRLTVTKALHSALLVQIH